MPSFGKHAKKRPPVRRESFDFTFLRDETPETYTFQARASADVVSLATVLNVAQNNPEAAMPSMLRLISKMLDNKDGTPLGWKATPLPLPPKPAEEPRYVGGTEFWAQGGTVVEQAEPPAPVDDDEPPVRKFRGPDGELHPFEDAAKFEEFEAGSSRRRWAHLMDDDDEVEVEYRDLTDLFEWLVGLAAGRPTQASS